MPERWRHYLRFWGPNVDADIDDELQYHLDMCVDAFMARGMSRDEARRAARDAFGDVGDVAGNLRKHDRQKLRQNRRADMFQDLVYDIRYGLRQLRSAPRFTAAVIAVLALGIAANTAIFSAIDAAFFRPLPFPQPERLVSLAQFQVPIDRSAFPSMPQSKKVVPEMSDFAEDTAAFANVAVYASGGLNLTGGAEPTRVDITYVTSAFMATLGVHPLIGRGFVPEEFTKNGPKGVVLSYHLWQEQFGQDSAVVGRPVALNGKSYRVDGVMPPAFRFPASAELWIPLVVPWNIDIMEAFRNFLPAVGIARLAPGVTVAQAARRADLIRQRFHPSAPHDGLWTGHTAADAPVVDLVRPLRTSLVGNSRTALLVLAASAALLLLIACANVTNLFLARAAERRREIAMRTVLGASRGRIIRQLTVESFLLAAAGSIVAVLVAYLSLHALTNVLPSRLAGVTPPAIDMRVLAFTLVVALGTSIVFAMWPVLGTSQLDLTEAMKNAGLGGGGSRRRGIGARGVLVIAEVSLATMLLIGAGLMLQSLDTLLRTSSGLRPEQVSTGRLVMPNVKYTTTNARTVLLESIIERLRTVPGIVAAGAVNSLPMEGVGGIGLQVLQAEAPADAEGAFGSYLIATPGYFAVIGAKLRGSDLPATVDSANKVVVINERLAHDLWPHEDALGRQIRLGGERRTVIGIVGDIRTDGLDAPAQGQLYLPMAGDAQSYASLVIRSSLNAKDIAARVHAAVRSVDPAQPVFAIRSMEEVIGASVAPRRTNTILLSIFGGVALLLAAVGVYAVLSYGVTQRTREIGIRTALGAQRSDVVRLVMRHAMVLSVSGLVIGFAGAFALSRYIRSMLYEVSPHDPRVFIVAPLALAVVALLATLMPALRATRVDPLTALREE